MSLHLAIIIVAFLLIAASFAYLSVRKRKKAKEVVLAIIQETSSQILSKYDYLVNSLLAEDHYFSYSEMCDFISSNADLLKKLDIISEYKSFSKCPNSETTKKFYDLLNNIESVRSSHNNSFVDKELAEHSAFFDSVMRYPLDNQQRNSIVRLEDNCLVVSSAGSGKTSTMIGKLRYLIEKREVSPSRILTITYTHKASEELTQRLQGTGLQCLTFHKLALNIIKEVSGESPSISSANLFPSVFYEKLKDIGFRGHLLNYLLEYRSLVKDEHAYDSSIAYYADRKKYGVFALFPDMDGKIIITKSEQEKKICSFLTELGVKFRYEEQYEINVMTEDFRQYKPDFSIYYSDSEGKQHRIYLEHFGVDREGNVPKWFGRNMKGGWFAANQAYHEGIEWKKQLHKEHGTKLFFTTSADFYDGTIKTKLRDILQTAGVPIREVSKEELLTRIVSRSKSVETAIMQMSQGFINLVKANGKTVEDILALAQNNHNERDCFVVQHLMKPLWDEYQAVLKKQQELDFTDIINLATRYCNEGKWKHKYEYILIDEFQDISIDRYRFLLSLRSDLPKTKLYCVGDDWQSIYRFSGSDMSLFGHFSDYFGFTEECKIETTYRFGNPIIGISSHFIQKNPVQKKKNVQPKVSAPQTKLSFVGYKSESHLQELVAKLVARVPEGKSIYIISRYNYDIKALISARQDAEFDLEKGTALLRYGNRKVRFMTIHSSKGLEADYVLMLNCNSGLYGFPSLVSDDPVMDYVLSDREHFEYAEERRVFYVGITRAKEHTVVFYDESHPSEFVTEIYKPAVINGTICPLCGVGIKTMKYQGVTRTKNKYRVWGCNNKEANCQYFEREFINTKVRYY